MFPRAIFGIGLGGDYMIIPLMTAEIFGIEILGRLLGVILTAGGIAEAAAPWLIGRLRDTTGSYSESCFVLVGSRVAGRTGRFGFAGAAEGRMSAGRNPSRREPEGCWTLSGSLAGSRPADPLRFPDRDRSRIAAALAAETRSIQNRQPDRGAAHGGLGRNSGWGAFGEYCSAMAALRP